ncbi:hypothetical protein YTPLAS18_40570 [Nitrospira sp.]|nr:hypothetical protein YTPLAS18_40570 [Nitrospira sp.]
MTKRIFGLVAIGMTLAPAALAASLQNGDFQDSSPPLDGWPTTGTASLATGAGTVKALRLHETCAPGLSRAFQTFDIPVNAATLSFRYRLTSPITPGGWHALGAAVSMDRRKAKRR